MKVIILPNDNKSPQENLDSTMRLFGGIPVFLHTVLLFEKYGFSDFIICDNSRGHAIRDYLYSNLDKIKGLKIKILKLPPYLKSPQILLFCQKNGVENAFFVAPNDVVTDLNVEKMLSYHRQNARAATVCVAEQKKYFGTGDANQGDKYEAKIVNSGFYIFEEEATDYMSPGESIDTDAVISMAENDELSVYSDNHFVQRFD